MSWDVAIFNLSRKVEKAEEIDESILVDIGTYANFKNILEKRYPDIKWDGNWGKIERDGFSIEFSIGDPEERISNTLFSLYGENAIYEIIELCKANGWQAFDTALEQMLDLEKPEINGYANHRKYIEQILKGQK